MTDQIIRWSSEYQTNNLDAPDRVALEALEWKELRDELGEYILFPVHIGPVQIFGMWTEFVRDDYNGPRVWKHPTYDHWESFWFAL